MDNGLRYEIPADESLIGFSDANWAGDMDNQHSTMGNLFVMSGGAISWLSRKQLVVALPTAEAEYVALTAATQEVVWLRRLLSDIKATPKTPTIIRELGRITKELSLLQGNQFLTLEPSILISSFTMCEKLYNDRIIELVYCPTDLMTAEILTKPLSLGQFEILRLKMGLKNLPSNLSGSVVIVN